MDKLLKNVKSYYLDCYLMNHIYNILKIFYHYPYHIFNDNFDKLVVFFKKYEVIDIIK